MSDSTTREVKRDFKKYLTFHDRENMRKVQNDQCHCTPERRGHVGRRAVDSGHVTYEHGKTRYRDNSGISAADLATSFFS